MQINSILLMAPPSGGGQSSIMSFLPIILIIIVFYFFMIRPQMKKAKDEKKFREELKKGDRIVTIGGIHGKISEINDATFVIEVEGGNRLKIERSAVSLQYTGQIGETK